jgi:hypothetical protein
MKRYALLCLLLLPKIASVQDGVEFLTATPRDGVAEAFSVEALN